MSATLCRTCHGTGYISDGDDVTHCDDADCGYWTRRDALPTAYLQARDLGCPVCRQCAEPLDADEAAAVDEWDQPLRLCLNCAEPGDTAPRDWKDVYK